jgi:hypothetical protein
MHSRNRLGPETALALSEALPRNDTLKTLRIGWNTLGAVGSIAIARALGSNIAIEVTIYQFWGMLTVHVNT